MKVRSNSKKAASRITYKANKQLGIISYDDDNCYPQRMLLLSNSSPTTKACLDTYGRFIEGNGFKDAVFYKAIINSDGLTNDKLLRLVATDLRLNRGIALHVNVSANGKVVEVYHVPFEHVRKLTAEKRAETGCDYAIYPDWNEQTGGIKKDKIDYLPAFNLDIPTINKQATEAGGWDQYKGQLIYVSLDYGSYPLASCDAILEPMFAEIQSDETTTNNVEENFSAKGMIVHKGKFESDEKREEFENDVEDFIGSEGANIIVVDVDKDEEKPEFIQIPIFADDKIFEYTDKKVTDKIIRNYLLPKILLSVTDGGFFNQEQIRDATMYYNTVTLRERTLLEETFSLVFTNFVTKINQNNDYSIIPIEFKLNKNELPSGFIDFISLDMPTAAKRAGLVVLFGLSPEEAAIMIPEGAIIKKFANTEAAPVATPN